MNLSGLQDELHNTLPTEGNKSKRKPIELSLSGKSHPENDSDVGLRQTDITEQNHDLMNLLLACKRCMK
jgi:hypothetical protein